MEIATVEVIKPIMSMTEKSRLRIIIQQTICPNHKSAWAPIRGLGWIWETGCVKNQLGVYSFGSLRSQLINFHFCLICSPQNTFFFFFPPFFFWPCIFKTDRYYHGHHGWLPKPLVWNRPLNYLATDLLGI